MLSRFDITKQKFDIKIKIKFKKYLLKILRLHVVLFKLEMIQANNKLFFTGKNHTKNLTLLNYLKYS